MEPSEIPFVDGRGRGWRIVGRGGLQVSQPRKQNTESERGEPGFESMGTAAA